VQVVCRITEGFRHQVRCHLAWVGLPVVGDETYGVSSLALPLMPMEVLPKKMKINFFATGLFFHLLDKDYSFRI
jgi:23S rRNA-/tRNA-specific pseudouridylate synthase